MDQTLYDAECPEGFQTAEFLQKHGQLDIVLDSAVLPSCSSTSSLLFSEVCSFIFFFVVVYVQDQLDATVGRLLRVLYRNGNVPTKESDSNGVVFSKSVGDATSPRPQNNYLNTRGLTRYQPQDILFRLFHNFTELRGIYIRETNTNIHFSFDLKKRLSDNENHR